MGFCNFFLNSAAKTSTADCHSQLATIIREASTLPGAVTRVSCLIIKALTIHKFMGFKVSVQRVVANRLIRPHGVKIS